jgi:deoxyadenosine/deoxycytidine kinase
MIFLSSAMPGTGKTSMTKFLAKAFNSKAFIEEVSPEKNPMLVKFYESLKDPTTYDYTYAFQTWQLGKRFQDLKEALKTRHSILDSHIYTDSVFASIAFQNNNLDPILLETYKMLAKEMMSEIDEIPNKTPMLNVYLSAPLDVILSRIKARNREFERWWKNPELLSYFTQLYYEFEKWFDNFDYCEKIRLDVSEDFIDNLENRERLIKQVVEKVRKIEG